MMAHSAWEQVKKERAMKHRNRLLPKIKAHLQESYNAKSAHRDTDHLHPSELSKKDWCPRSAYYKIMAYPESKSYYDVSRLNVFEEGNAIHKKWQKWLKEIGVLWGFWYCGKCGHYWQDKSPSLCPSCQTDYITYREVPIRDDEHMILGHADGEIEDDQGRALIEIKSIGPGTIRWEMPSLYFEYESGNLSLDKMWDSINRPFPSHLRQGNLYMHCRKIDTMIYIYEWKPDQRIKEFELKINRSLVEPILDNCKLVMDHLDREVLPDRPTWAINDQANGCKYCPYKETCWNGPTD
jgi:rubrerythrin